MASREIRRITQKKGEQATQKTQVDIRKEKHPVLFIGSIVVFIIIAVSFIGIGSGSNTFGNQQKVIFGKYAGKPIYYDALNYFGLKHRAAAENSQNNQNPNQATDPTRDVWYTAYTETVKHEAILDVMKKTGYHVSDSAVDTALQNYPSYLDKNGKFSEKRYTETPLREKTAAKALYKEILLESTYLRDNFDSRYFSKNEMDFFKSMQNTERAFKFIEYTFDTYPDDKVKEYGKEHLKDFSSIKLSRILLIDYNLADANKIINEYNSNQKSFEDLATEYSRDFYANQKGDMGIQYYYQIRNFFEETKKAEQLADEIFMLKEGNVSAPIQIGKNWAIFKANSASEEANLETPETITGIRQYILNYKRDEVEDYLVSQANILIEDGKTKGFDLVAREAGKTVYETDYFPINYLSIIYGKSINVKGEDTTRLNSAADKKDFFITAFGLKKEEISKPVLLENKLVVLQLIEEKTIDQATWEKDNSSWKYSVMYQSPGILEINNEENASYLYILLTNSYFQQDFNNSIINPKKHQNNFDATFIKAFYPAK